MTTPSILMLSANPLVGVAEDFIDQHTSAHLIHLAQTRLQRAQISDDDQTLRVASARTNSDAHLPPDADPAIADLMRRLAELVGLPPSHGEGLSILHYAAGQEFTPHVDGVWSGASAEARAAFEADGGQRLFTTILYLNDAPSGGATTFPDLGLRIPAAAGRLLIFANTEAGSPDASRRALHAGEPVEQGEKWVAVAWWRQRPFDASGGAAAEERGANAEPAV